MKNLFIEARHRGGIDIRKYAEKLPGRIGLITTVQHIGQLDDAKKQLEEKGKKVFTAKGTKAKYPSQVLGCDVGAASKIKGRINAFLYIGSGKFHPLMVLAETEKPVFAYNPLTEEFRQMGNEEAEKMKKRKKGALLKFMSSKKIGVLVSTKPGQNRLKEADKLEKKYPGKEFFILVFDTLDFSQLENFPFIECFVNTACPRIAYDDLDKFRAIGKAVVNIDEVL